VAYNLSAGDNSAEKAYVLEDALVGTAKLKAEGKK
jgi:hypothetical protein